MKQLNRKTIDAPLYPERILQIGEGNFLRCFIDWQVDILNETMGLNAGVVVARPIQSAWPPSLNTQDGLYTTLLRGYDDSGVLHDDRRLITAVTREIAIYEEYAQFLALAHNPDIRFIVSNTTEAGIAFNDQDQFDDTPPGEYPAKLTRLLFERFTACKGAEEGGFILLPCELIDYNGEELKKIVLQYAALWDLSDSFQKWLLTANTFCSTLVDRIVTGYPKTEQEQLAAELGYDDQFMAAGEYFHLFVIQAPQHVADELKIVGSGLHIEVVEDLKPYKKRKVGILNGCHTALMPIAHLCGYELVKDAVADADLARFLELLLEKEIIPYLGMPEDYLKAYAATVVDRFKNPFINHRWLDISLNSMTKFRTRVLPQFLLYYEDKQNIPPLMSLAFAALLLFYRGEVNGSSYPVKDDQCFLNLYKELWQTKSELDQERAEQIATRILELDEHWQADLLTMTGLKEKVAADMVAIVSKGMQARLLEYLS